MPVSVHAHWRRTRTAGRDDSHRRRTVGIGCEHHRRQAPPDDRPVIENRRGIDVWSATMRAIICRIEHGPRRARARYLRD